MGRLISWHVAYTKPKKELLAKEHLLAQSYEIYIPHLKKICCHARKIQVKVTPLFPRYIFIGIDSNLFKWTNINATPGISYLLMANNTTPAKIPTNVIENLRSQELEPGIVPVSSLISFIKGDKVRITEGAFKQQVAFFEAMDHKSRVQLLLNFMGRDLNITLPLYSIEVA